LADPAIITLGEHFKRAEKKKGECEHYSYHHLSSSPSLTSIRPKYCIRYQAHFNLFLIRKFLKDFRWFKSTSLFALYALSALLATLNVAVTVEGIICGFLGVGLTSF
jgi:hypothetical protein